MDEEKALVEAAVRDIQNIREKKGFWHESLYRYLQIIPEPFIRGLAQQKVRDYFRLNPGKKLLADEERAKLREQIATQILNEIILKTRGRNSDSSDDMDGAELFFRRALNYLGTERFADAERMLLRAVEICPDFVEAWRVLIELYEQTDRPELAYKAKLVVGELEGEQ